MDPTPATVDAAEGEGCWVQLYRKRPLGLLPGYLDVQSLAPPGLIGECDDKHFLEHARSLLVGPQARLIAYAKPGFTKEVVSLEPRRRVPDLRVIGFPDGVASLKILCEKG